MVSLLGRRLLDPLVHPQLRDFALGTVLRTGRSELLAGAAHAATAVSEARLHALQGDSSVLHALERDGALDTALHAHMQSEAHHAHEVGGSALQAMVSGVECQLEDLQGPASLLAVRLVVGARREGFQGDGLYALCIGSHLVVVGARPSGLWRQAVQHDLLLEHGCSVQCAVGFERAQPVGFSQPPTLLLEASCSGEWLRRSSQHPLEAPGDEDGEGGDCWDTPPFALVDLDRRVGGAAFWEQATPVSLAQAVAPW